MRLLELKIVCEGVETEEQNAFVGESGCDFVQGWYYSTALSELKAEAFAQEYAAKL
jgi:sensor c-di-GMP phosphodiesterase-like protein